MWLLTPGRQQCKHFYKSEDLYNLYVFYFYNLLFKTF